MTVTYSTALGDKITKTFETEVEALEFCRLAHELGYDALPGTWTN